LRYTPGELAILAEESWAFFATRRPRGPAIRLSAPVAPAEGQLASISVLEIVNDNMPFLVDSVMSELNERGLEVRLVAHPIFAVERDAGGRVLSLKATEDRDAHRDSFIHMHLERIYEEGRQHEIVAAIETVLKVVGLAVQDWRAIVGQVQGVAAGLRADPPPLPPDEIEEAAAFIDWLIDNNFTFLGTREYALTAHKDALAPRFDTGLGILRSPDIDVLLRGSQVLTITPGIRTILAEPTPLIITKTARRSRVHRRVHMDFIAVKRYDADGRLAGAFAIVGLFTSTAYTRSTRSIPFLRRKVAAVIARAGFDPQGHSGKALANVLETFPRDELFRIDNETLYHFGIAILQLEERPRVRVLPRRDRFDRFVSVVVYVPRERYTSDVRHAIGEHLAQAYNGQVSGYYPFISESPLVRAHYIIGRKSGAMPSPDRHSLEAAVSVIIRTWQDGLREALNERSGHDRSQVLFERYEHAFSVGYREAYSPENAIADIRLIEALSPGRPIGIDFYRRPHVTLDCVGLKVWSYSSPIPLSDRVPVLENMGFRVVDERTFAVTPRRAGASDVWLHDMALERADGGDIDLEKSERNLEDCFAAVMSGRAENDGYNALVLEAGLTWREVALVRAISRFLRQIRVPFSQDYMWETLTKHGAIAARIVEAFHVRFDPAREGSLEMRRGREDALRAEIDTALQAVDSLDEDRILRHFVNAVRAAQRTNYFQAGADGQPKAQIAIKFASRELDGVPLPAPLYEIFVYSPRVEGVHLRFGQVARGGIRWSDRPQDFRTEVLGLVKAQQVKNAVIVPVGAKGGFVPKHLPKGGPREAIQAEGTAAYKLFINTLLDVTDNLGLDGLLPPPDVVRHDGDDPYLVVAADKGTATFSDIANAISQERGFWLGDAFASGGSVGYDHKKMGITARGAWEAVKRHFREMDIDIGVTPFTVAGVGDMSGDVFGNGMLLERTTKLVAAFDHRDIFIDPDPDPEKSLGERRRLFDLPRSSWQDYDKALISAGGGVYSRAAKEVALSPEARALLGLGKAKLTPRQVMTAILKLPVDLLWFGGIGTYVRATAETDETVGDRANDPIRITGADLKCKVIGEGANLGVTQRGRIEAALAGVRLNTDAIDNSAGVNTSDLEVNLKIALKQPCDAGALTGEGRNALLAEITDDVARLVLRNNYPQTLSLSVAQLRGLQDFGFQQRLIQVLEARGLLDRAVEQLPDDMEIEERRRRSQAFTRPELAVLLAYAKLALKDELLQSKVPDDPYLGRELTRYFPPVIGQRFPAALEQHRLRREIIATQLANSMINRGGPALIMRIADQTGAAADGIAAAFAAVRDSFGMGALNGEIDALDNKVDGGLQLDLYAAVRAVLLDRLVWFLRNVDLAQGLAAVVDHYRDGIAAVAAVLDDVLSQPEREAIKARCAELVAAGVPEPLAHRLTSLRALTSAPDIVLVAERTGKPVTDVAATFFAAANYFRLDQIAHSARQIVTADYFDRLALDRSLDSIGDAERRLTAAMVADGKVGDAAVTAWVGQRVGEVERIRSGVQEIALSGLTLSKLSVAASLLGDLVKT
jgi:glutamate dehydrogenase